MAERGLSTRVPACIAGVTQFREVFRCSVVPMRTLGSPGLARVTGPRNGYISTVCLTVAIGTSVCLDKMKMPRLNVTSQFMD